MKRMAQGKSGIFRKREKYCVRLLIGRGLISSNFSQVILLIGGLRILLISFPKILPQISAAIIVNNKKKTIDIRVNKISPNINIRPRPFTKKHEPTVRVEKRKLNTSDPLFNLKNILCSSIFFCFRL